MDNMINLSDYVTFTLNIFGDIMYEKIEFVFILSVELGYNSNKVAQLLRK